MDKNLKMTALEDVLLYIFKEKAIQACRDHEVSLALLGELDDALFLNKIEGCNNYLDYYPDHEGKTQYLRATYNPFAGHTIQSFMTLLILVAGNFYLVLLIEI